MERENKYKKLGFLAILISITVLLLYVVPCVGLPTGPLIGPQTVPSGETLNLGTIYDPNIGVDNGWVDVYGTLNMYPGAYVDLGIYALDSSEVNIYAGELGVDMFNQPYSVNVSIGAKVTVYGTNFDVSSGIIGPEGSWTPGLYPGGTLTGEFENGNPIDLLFSSDIPIYLVDIGVKDVTIDIKPGSYPNSINLGSNGVIPVAILSEEGFDATTVDPDTVALAGAGVAVRGKGNKLLANEEDVNGDGLMDLVIKVETENLETGQDQDGYAVLTGNTYDGQAIEGSDEITIVPPEPPEE